LKYSKQIGGAPVGELLVLHVFVDYDVRLLCLLLLFVRLFLWLLVSVVVVVVPLFTTRVVVSFIISVAVGMGSASANASSSPASAEAAPAASAASRMLAASLLLLHALELWVRVLASGASSGALGLGLWCVVDFYSLLELLLQLWQVFVSLCVGIVLLLESVLE
jgi:hypothetical protein